MWKANHDDMHAGIGHRHTAARRARTAKAGVDDADARLAAIYVDGAGIKQRLDALQTESSKLADLAHPSPGGFGLEELNRDHVSQIDQLLNAVDVWTTWADGRPVGITALAEAVADLTETARQAPLFAPHPGDIDRSQWIELLEPVTDLLRQRGIEPPTVRDVPLGWTGPELGIEL